MDQRTRTLAYEAAMERLAAKYPDDDEAQVFHALAINEAVDLADKTYARQLKAGEILERVDARVPDHPGVVHYLVHTYDFGPLAERGLVTVLASDYHWPALLEAPFALARRGNMDLARAWALVSGNPAAAAGLADRGALRPGMRGDVVLVDPAGPEAVAVFCAGLLAHLTAAGAARLVA